MFESDKIYFFDFNDADFALDAFLLAFATGSATSCSSSSSTVVDADAAKGDTALRDDADAAKDDDAEAAAAETAAALRFFFVTSDDVSMKSVWSSTAWSSSACVSTARAVLFATPVAATVTESASSSIGHSRFIDCSV